MTNTNPRKARHYVHERLDLATRVQRRIEIARQLAQRTRMMIARLDRYLETMRGTS